MKAAEAEVAVAAESPTKGKKTPPALPAKPEK